MEAAAGLGAPPELRLLRTQRQGASVRTTVLVALPMPDAAETGPRSGRGRPGARRAGRSRGRPRVPRGRGPGRARRSPWTELGLGVPDVVLIAQAQLDAYAADRCSEARRPEEPRLYDAQGLDRLCSLVGAQRGLPAIAGDPAGATAELRARLAALRAAAATVVAELGAAPPVISRGPALGAARRSRSGDRGAPGAPRRARRSGDRRIGRRAGTERAHPHAARSRRPGSRVICTGVLPATTAAPGLDRDWLEIVAAVRPALARLEAAPAPPTSGRRRRARRTGSGLSRTRARSKCRLRAGRGRSRADRGRAARRLGRDRPELQAHDACRIRLRRAACPGRAGDPPCRPAGRAGRAHRRGPAGDRAVHPRAGARADGAARPAGRVVAGRPDLDGAGRRPRRLGPGGPDDLGVLPPGRADAALQRRPARLLRRGRGPALDARPAVAGRRARRRGRGFARARRAARWRTRRSSRSPESTRPSCPRRHCWKARPRTGGRSGRRVRVGRAVGGGLLGRSNGRPTRSSSCPQPYGDTLAGEVDGLALWRAGLVGAGDPALTGLLDPPGLLAAGDADVRDRGDGRRRRAHALSATTAATSTGSPPTRSRRCRIRIWPHDRSFRSGCTTRVPRPRAGGRSRTPQSTSAGFRPTDRTWPRPC